MFWPFKHKEERYPEIKPEKLEKKIESSKREREELERRLNKIRTEIAVMRLRRGH